MNARIVAVADAYDAMVSFRPYRSSLTHEEALAELQKQAGTQFDPRIIEAFMSSMGKEKDPITLFRQKGIFSIPRVYLPSPCGGIMLR